MSFLEKMWQDHRTATIVVGLILFPITIAIIGLKLYMGYQVNAAHKEVKQAQEKDNKLAAEENSFKQQANDHLAEADKAAQRIEDRKDELPDLDWQNKRKD